MYSSIQRDLEKIGYSGYLLQSRKEAAGNWVLFNGTRGVQKFK